MKKKRNKGAVCARAATNFKKVHGVQITEEWMERLKRRLPWVAEVPALLRDLYNVAKVDARLGSLTSVPLWLQEQAQGQATCNRQGLRATSYRRGKITCGK